MGMLLMWLRFIHLSESRCHRWKTGTSNKLLITAGRTLWSRLWFNLHCLCSRIGLCISAIGSLPEMDVFSGKHNNKRHNWPIKQKKIVIILQCFCAMILFYCAHWQTYVSGTLRFGKVDVTEAQCAIISIHMISAIFGPSIWMTKVRHLQPPLKKKNLLYLSPSLFLFSPFL